MSELRIITKEVTKSKEHKGWKVYIDGSKWPKKPVDYYAGTTEEQAVKKAVEEFREYYNSPLFSGLCDGLDESDKRRGKCRITDSCENPVNVPQPIKTLQTDRLFMDSPNTGDPSCLCSRCGLVISGVGIIRLWPEQGEGEYRYHPECLI